MMSERVGKFIGLLTFLICPVLWGGVRSIAGENLGATACFLADMTALGLTMSVMIIFFLIANRGEK